MWPVIQRELTEGSRRRGLWVLRLAGAAAPMLALWAGGAGAAAGTNGGGLFGRINALLVTLCWMAGPVLTADCLSRERREGTMGLLFLTPLGPREVVVAKAVAVFLRAGSLLLASMPLLAVPVLMGGVGWMDLARMALTLAASLLIGLSAGLLASSWVTGWLAVRVAAAGVSTAAAILFGAAFTFVRSGQQWWQWRAMPRGFSFGDLWLRNTLSALGRLGLGPYPGELVWTGGMGAHSDAASLVAAAVDAAAGFVLAAATIALAARVLDRTWRPTGRSAAVEMAVDVLTRRPLFPTWARRGRRALLTRSPAVWLQNLSWRARVISSVTTGVAAMYLVSYATYRTATIDEFRAATSVLMAVAAVAAASSFRVERENGALELLLTTTLKPSSIASGRVAAVISHFLPAALLISGSFGYLGLRRPSAPWAYAEVNLWTAMDIAPWTCAVAALAVGISTTGASLATAILAPLALRHAFLLTWSLAGGDGPWPPDGLWFAASTAAAAATVYAGWRLAEFGLAERRFLGRGG